MQKLAAVHFPKIDTREIDSFREKYDPSYEIIPAHITIVAPVSEIPENKFIEYIESAVKDISSYSTHLTGLYKTSDKHLFLKIKEGNEKIVSLHDKLYSGILHPYIPTDFPFVPHITLGYFNESDKMLDEAYNEAQQIDFDLTSDFDSLFIIKGDGIGPVKIIKTIALQK